MTFLYVACSKCGQPMDTDGEGNHYCESCEG